MGGKGLHGQRKKPDCEVELLSSPFPFCDSFCLPSFNHRQIRQVYTMHPLRIQKAGGVGGATKKREQKSIFLHYVFPYRISFSEDKMTSYALGKHLYSVNSEYSNITI